jgi:hypothetical protein
MGGCSIIFSFERKTPIGTVNALVDMCRCRDIGRHAMLNR